MLTARPHSATKAAARTFNTAGPVRAHRDYPIAPLSRIDLEEVLGLIRDEKYFVLHAPRQTCKTSAMLDALCYDARFRHKPGRDRAHPITAAPILEAQERLIPAS